MPVTIHPPVSGIWKLFTSRGHHPYSKDFVALDYRCRAMTPAQRLQYLFTRLDAEDLPGWGQPVLAPLAGKVLHLAQDHDDHTDLNAPRDRLRQRMAARRADGSPGFFLGNHLILETDDGLHVLLAHLKKSSIRVVPGQRVAAGEMLGKVGNSGVSLLPHLHFHITQPAAENPDQPLPFIFDHFDALENDVWQHREMLLPLDHKPFKATGIRNDA